MGWEWSRHGMWNAPIVYIIKVINVITYGAMPRGGGGGCAGGIPVTLLIIIITIIPHPLQVGHLGVAIIQGEAVRLALHQVASTYYNYRDP